MMIINSFQTKYIKIPTRVRIKPEAYADTKNLALRVYDDETGGLLCMATINPPDILDSNKSLKLEKGLVAIKNYSENQGVLETLIANGVIEKVAEKIIPISNGINVSVHQLTDIAFLAFYGPNHSALS